LAGSPASDGSRSRERKRGERGMKKMGKGNGKPREERMWKSRSGRTGNKKKAYKI